MLLWIMYGSNVVCMTEIHSPSYIVTILLIITDKKKLEYSTSFVIGPIK